uniref:Calcineurin-like phosphoesterase n=3 Tax=viral metagenome TaxID=1070528 RepID=A0A6M3JT00_9ZZZZ
MEVRIWNQKYTAKSTMFRLYPVGDIHAGTLHCAEDKIKKQVKIINDDPFGIWIGMGDYGEFIVGNDPRFDIGVIADWVQPDDIAESQREWLFNLWKPIASKCVGLIEGNHEDSMRLHFKGDVQSHLCKDLGVPNLGYSCFVRFRFQRTTTESHMFVGHFEHGSGGALTEGGKLNRLKRGLYAFDADLYGMGHLHDIYSHSPPYITLSHTNEIVSRNRAAAITGAWVRTYTQGVRANYAEKRGYPPAHLGCPVFHITPYIREITVEG